MDDGRGNISPLMLSLNQIKPFLYLSHVGPGSEIEFIYVLLYMKKTEFRAKCSVICQGGGNNLVQAERANVDNNMSQKDAMKDINERLPNTFNNIYVSAH